VNEVKKILDERERLGVSWANIKRRYDRDKKPDFLGSNDNLMAGAGASRGSLCRLVAQGGSS